MPTKIEIIQAMEAAAFTDDWEKFNSFFSQNLYYKVGNTVELRGPQAVADYLINLRATELAINELVIRTAWETEDTVVLELNMKGLRLRDNKNVAYPCVDLYRFDGDKVRDWRVYAIEPTFVV